MASKALLLTMIIAATAVPAFAADYVVGDDSGWTLGVNYTAWAHGKFFSVGDRIFFVYDAGAHNVYKVNGSAFKQCWVPPPSEALTSGNDVITLATPGKKWYISGVADDCERGMKLVITVASSCGPAPSPFTYPPFPAATLMNAKKPASFWKLKFHL